MTQKKLNTQAVVNELKGQSAFFENSPRLTPLSDQPLGGNKQGKVKDKTGNQQTNKPPQNHDAVTPRNHDTTVSRYHDTTIESVRKAVKVYGKEAATHRFTAEEKEAIADVIYAYKQRGVKTSENEVTRIAVNFLLNDYKENGENSILHRVLKALNG